MYKLLMLLPQAKIAIKYYNAIIVIIVLTDLFLFVIRYIFLLPLYCYILRTVSKIAILNT